MISRKFDGKANVTGENIERIRKQRKLSRAALSNKLMIIGIDINYDSIYKIENGRRIVKDFELSSIARILGVTESDLLEGFKEKLG